MITWYCDEETCIKFSEEPHIDIRYIKPSDEESTIKNIEKKPFVLKNNIKIFLINFIEQEEYNFEIAANYCWDGATIPKIFYRLIGANTDNRFLIASMVHDILCENHEIVNDDRYFSTVVFERLLYVSKVSPFKRWLMKHSVDNYQKIKGNW